eukprot:7231835-Alexandrium_andersonii.AAC.1
MANTTKTAAEQARRGDHNTFRRGRCGVGGLPMGLGLRAGGRAPRAGVRTTRAAGPERSPGGVVEATKG